MIITLILNAIVILLLAIFSGLDDITVLPTILGFNIDSALVSGMGYINTFMVAFWPLRLMFDGFLILMGYYAIKMVLTFILGHRAPGGR